MTSEALAVIKEQSQRVGIRARDVAATVKDTFKESAYTQRDINNARSYLRLQERDGYTAAGALIKWFDNEGITYVHKMDPANPDRLLGIVFTLPWCEAMWKRHSELLSIDNTYKTNKSRYPLMMVTTVSGINTVLNLAFGLINDETRESFDFLIDGLN
jgi:hypothetical protein